MTDTYDLIIRGGDVWATGGLARTDVAVREGKVAHVGNLGGADAETVIDAVGLTVLPGMIDSQVHFREPGNEQKEDLESGTRSAALGGITAVFEMPNTDPLTTSAEALADKISRAAGRSWTDHAFFMGASAENADQLAELERVPGCCGVKLFMGSSTGNLLVPDDETVRRVLSNGTRRMSVHSEDEYRLGERKGERVEGDPSSHPVWRDEETAIRSTKRLLSIARETRRRVHVLHITTAEEVEILAGYKDDIENKLYAANPGVKSRFQRGEIMFEDYNEAELRRILLGMVHKHRWRLEDDKARSWGAGKASITARGWNGLSRSTGWAP